MGLVIFSFILLFVLVWLIVSLIIDAAKNAGMKEEKRPVRWLMKKLLVSISIFAFTCGLAMVAILLFGTNEKMTVSIAAFTVLVEWGVIWKS